MPDQPEPIDTESIREALEGPDAIVQSATVAGRSVTRASLKDQVDAVIRLEARAERRAARRARIRFE
jgi:hypothetical protein